MSDRGTPVVPLDPGVDPETVIFVAEGSPASRHVDWSKLIKHKNKNEKVRIYVIAQVGGDFVKIGIAHDPLKRLGTVQTGSPVKLALIAQSDPMTRERAKQVEAKAHAALVSKATVGEWFACSADEAMKVVAGAL